MVAPEGAKWKRYVTSAGIEVEYGPFPGAMYWEIMDRALQEYPDPDPPTKIYETVDGPEEGPDEDDPEYKKKKSQAVFDRNQMVLEAALDMCVNILSEWEPILERIEKKWVKDIPNDPDDRKLWFLTKYALRTDEDWGIIRKIRRFSQIEDEEVANRAEFFRGDVAGHESPGPDAPGAGKAERVEVHDET